MTLVKAPFLGIERFANGRDKENRRDDSHQARNATLRAVYQQVLGHQHVMESERLSVAESLFQNGRLSVQELVRMVAKSGLYRSRFFENCNPYKFIELNHKHLLGRAPQNKAEMLHHFTILQEQGYDAEIDSYIDSAEYQERFGSETVPYLHGWDYSRGQQGRQFSWLMQLARGAAASVKGDPAKTNSRLGRALHQDRAMPVTGPSASSGPFRARVAAGEADSTEQNLRSGSQHSPSQSQRLHSLPVAAGSRSSASGAERVVRLRVTGLANNAYVRSADVVQQVPLSRLNEALRRIQRLGGRVTLVEMG